MDNLLNRVLTLLSDLVYLRDANTKMGNPIAEFMHFSCIRCTMKTYSEIYRDFCNTTRLRLKSFWHFLEEKKRQEEEQLKRFTQSFLDKIFS